MSDDIYKSKLETFTGTQEFKNKKVELGSFFKQEKDISYINGTPIYDDNIKQRLHSHIQKLTSTNNNRYTTPLKWQKLAFNRYV